MRLGIALSGGGIRGLSHLGALRALMEKNIKPDMISGCSSGSIIAGLYACGLSIDNIEKITIEYAKSAIDINYTGILQGILLRIFSGKGKLENCGFIKGDRLEQFVHHYTKGIKMNETVIPLAIPAVDINNGKQVVFISKEPNIKDDKTLYIEDAYISEAVRSSSAIPAIFTPKTIQRYGLNLVDGGLRDYVPFESLIAMGADKIVCFNLGYNGQLKTGIDTIFEVVSQTLNIVGYSINQLKKEKYEIVEINQRYRNKYLRGTGNSKVIMLDPEIYDAKTLEINRAKEMIERGYNFTRKHIEDIKNFIYEN